MLDEVLEAKTNNWGRTFATEADSEENSLPESKIPYPSV